MASADGSSRGVEEVIRGIELRPELREIGRRADELAMLLVMAPAGSGKTTLISAWREDLATRGRQTAWIDLAPFHADPGPFLKELASELDNGIQPDLDDDRFGATLFRRLPHLGEPDPDSLARLLAAELQELGEPIVLFLDNYHRLPVGCAVDRILSQLLRLPVSNLHLVLATRGASPSATARIEAEGLGMRLSFDDLSFRADQVERILLERGVRLDDESLARLLAQTKGWVTGVLLAARMLSAETPAQASRIVSDLARHEDLFAYVAAELLDGEEDVLVTLVEHASLLGPARRELLEAYAGEDGARRIDDALGRGLLLRTGRLIGLHQLWEGLVRERLRRRLGGDALRARIAAAVCSLEKAGESERAVELSIELGQPELALTLIERHGFEWIELGYHENVERWLEAVAAVDRDSLDLDVVRAMLDGRRDAVKGVEALGAAADRLRARGDYDREVEARHSALILAENEGRRDLTLRILMQLVSVRRLISSPEARATAMLFMALAAGLGGRHGLARRMLDRCSRRNLAPRERGSVGIARGGLGILAGEYEHTLELVDETLRDPLLRRHGPAYFALRGMRALALALLGRDIPRAIGQLEEARDAFADFRLSGNEAQMSAFIARIHFKAGDAVAARDALERSLRVYSSLEASEGEANTRSLLACCHRVLGNPAAARSHALATLEVYDRGSRLRFRPWCGGVAAWLLAEEGEVDVARRFVNRHARALDCPGLPASQHMLQTALARIAELAGDEDAMLHHLRRGDLAAAEASLDVPSPEAPPELIDWAARAMREHGIESWLVGRQGDTAKASTATASALSVTTLGEFLIERRGEPIENRAWRGATAQRLFQRLLVAGGRPLSREQIGVDLWPDASPAKARGSLRVALSKLRQTLEPERAAGEVDEWLRIEGEHISLRSEVLASWDVTHWKRLFAQAAEADAASAIELRRQALDLYRGPFLPDNLEDWAIDLRRDFETTFAREGHRALGGLQEQGRLEEAEELAEWLTAHDPTDQIAWAVRAAIELERGNVDSARQLLDRARETLERELDLAPGPELQAIARAISQRITLR